MPDSSSCKATQEPEKVGAGLLFVCQSRLLLLKRSSRHNDKTWGLPGGNVEPGDVAPGCSGSSSLLPTALREAEEEVGPLPRHLITSIAQEPVVTRRGKRNQKLYSVYIAHMAPEALSQWAPRLNHEHTHWAWFPAAPLLQAGQQHGGKLGDQAVAVQALQPPAPESPLVIDLHPVVAKLLGEEGYRVQLLQLLQP